MNADPPLPDDPEPTRWHGEAGWRAAEDWLVDRLADLGWWEAAAWAAGHERTRPRLTALALQTYATQAADAGKQEHLEQASKRLTQRARRALWSKPGLGPPAGIDPDSVAEVTESAIGVVYEALVATVLHDELERGVLPERRHDQLLQAVGRTGLPGFTVDADADGSPDDTDGTMPG
ncbi:MAG: hypothetical protein ACR2QO_23775 [Acidimicrobiales bacterium]